MIKSRLALLLLAILLALLAGGCSGNAAPPLGKSGQTTLVFVYTDN